MGCITTIYIVGDRGLGTAVLFKDHRVKRDPVDFVGSLWSSLAFYMGPTGSYRSYGERAKAVLRYKRRWGFVGLHQGRWPVRRACALGSFFA